jgi:hypothetical protein
MNFTSVIDNCSYTQYEICCENIEVIRGINDGHYWRLTHVLNLSCAAAYLTVDNYATCAAGVLRWLHNFS